VFVWLASSVMGDFAKLPQHVQVAEELFCAMASKVFELLNADLLLMEQNPDITQEVIDLMGRALRRFPHVPQTPMFQTSLQFTMVRLFLSICCNPPANRIIRALIRDQVSIASRNERILDASYPFLNCCLSLPTVALSIVQRYGHHMLTELLPRIKGAYPQKFLRDIAVVLQKIFVQDTDSMPIVAMDILCQVRFDCRAARFDEHRV
jgi:hypothetical protein